MVNTHHVKPSLTEIIKSFKINNETSSKFLEIYNWLFIKILFYIFKYFVIRFYLKVNYVNNFNLFIISERVELYHTNFNTYITLHIANMTCIIKLLLLNQKFVVGH